MAGRDESRALPPAAAPAHHLQPVAAIDQCRLLERARYGLEVILQQPDRERQREGQIGDDQRRQVVEQAVVLDRQVERHDQRDAGQHPRAEIEPEQGAAAAETESRQAVARQRAEDEIERPRSRSQRSANSSCREASAPRRGCRPRRACRSDRRTSGSSTASGSAGSIAAAPTAHPARA